MKAVSACARRKGPARFSLRKGCRARVDWLTATELFTKELGNTAGRQTACEVSSAGGAMVGAVKEMYSCCCYATEGLLPRYQNGQSRRGVHRTRSRRPQTES